MLTVIIITLFVLLSLFIRYKFRLLWQQFWMLESKLNQQQSKLVNLKKQTVLLKTTDLKLPALMPSQHGEDIILNEYFSDKRDGYFVEVGGYDGINLSNTYFFEALGWDGLIIEPNPKWFNEYEIKRPYSRHINALVMNSKDELATLSIVEDESALSYSEANDRHLNRVKQTGSKITELKVKTIGLSEAIGNLNKPIDFISIDVEGAELKVLESLDFNRHSPEVFVIEDNSNGADNTISNFLSQNGYKKIYRLGCNDFYIQKNNNKQIHDIF